MDGVAKAGRYLFVIALAGFGLEHFLFIRSHFLGSILPYTADGPVSAVLSGAILLAASASLATGRGACVTARLLGAGLILDFVAVHIPRMARAPGAAGIRGLGFEVLSIGAIAFMLAPMFAAARSEVPAGNGRLGLSLRTTAQIGRYLFAVSLVIFGTLHFMEIPLIASLIPAWMPGHVFLAYFTGAGMIAAGLAIAAAPAIGAGEWARLAGILLAAMFVIFVVTLHTPRVAHAITNGDEWTSLLVPVAMAGGGLIVSEAFAGEY